MKISPLNNISFQKKLVANCAVRDMYGQVPCKIYNLEEGDEEYFDALKDDIIWGDNFFLGAVSKNIKEGKVADVFVLEDNKKDCLGYAQIYDNSKDKITLKFLEAKGKLDDKYKNNNRYVGETILNFVVQLAKSRGRKIVHIEEPLPTAYDFYERCNFRLIRGQYYSYEMYTKDSKKLEDNNLKHTGSKIEFTA